MYAYERSLVKRLSDKPFALIGVNTDQRERIKKVIKEENITWRSFWDGQGTQGPISTAWGIQAWPSLFIIDAKGIIRYKQIHGEKAIDEAIDTLLKEIEEG